MAPTPEPMPPDAADPVLAACVAELTEGHGCHTVLLYGSYARGDATPASDYDLAGLWSAEGSFRIAHARHGGYMDAFVYPETVVEGAGEEFLKLVGGRVLVQRDGLGDRFLARVDALYQAGPAPWPDDERAAAHAWIGKTVARIARGDIEGHYRRVMLLHDLLGDYFRARDAWFLGPKAGFAWLAANDPAAYQAFETALAPGAGHDAIEALGRIMQAHIDAAAPRATGR